MWRFSLDPLNRVLSEKLVVSTTSVSPSHRPVESPIHLRIVGGKCSAFIRMMRASCTISFRISTESRRLYDLMQVVVQHGKRRRTGRGPESQQTTLAKWTAFGVVVRAWRGIEPRIVFTSLLVGRRPGRARHALLRFRRELRDAAVRRVDQNRGALPAVDGHVAGAVVDPEVVVATDISRRAGRTISAGGRRVPVAAARQPGAELRDRATCFSSFAASSSVSTSG